MKNSTSLKTQVTNFSKAYLKNTEVFSSLLIDLVKFAAANNDTSELTRFFSFLRVKDITVATYYVKAALPAKYNAVEKSFGKTEKDTDKLAAMSAIRTTVTNVLDYYEAELAKLGIKPEVKEYNIDTRSKALTTSLVNHGLKANLTAEQFIAMQEKQLVEFKAALLAQAIEERAKIDKELKAA